MIFQRSDDIAPFRDSAAQHRLGRVFVIFSNTATKTRVRLYYSIVSTIYSNTDSGDFVCWFACSFVYLFVCLGPFVSLFLCFTVQRPRLGFLFYTLVYYIVFLEGTVPL